MVSESVWPARLTVPLFPLMLTIAWPVVALRLAVIFRVDVPVAVTGFGVKLALTPFGRPATARTAGTGPVDGGNVTGGHGAEPTLEGRGVGGSENVKTRGVAEAPALKEAIAVLQLKLNRMLFRE